MIPQTVEIRVPTYRRPALLRRALESLVLQSHSEWVAIVFDDSPDREAESVVSSFDSPKILYRPNGKNLGCAQSLDQAFRTQAYVGGEYACVLEDDNVYYPNFLKANIECILNSGCNVVLRNQETWFQSDDGSYSFTNGHTLAGNWTEGTHGVIEVAAMLFCQIPISNGGLFWRCSAKSDLSVGVSVKDGALQEYARTSQIVESVYCAMDPLAKYTVMNTTTRGGVPYVQAASFLRQLRKRLLAIYGKDLLREAVKYSGRNRGVSARKWMAQDLGILSTPASLLYLLKGWAISLRGKNPYPDYFSRCRVN